jgi:DNA repair exonuclease SbcCD nuclease subunit
MSKYLFVGDPHGTPDDLDDLKQLFALIWGVAKKHNATVVIAGDLYHTHAIIHAEVLYAWWNFLQDLKEDYVKAILVKGNHDMPGGNPNSKAASLWSHFDQAECVILQPHVEPGILFCPYTSGEQLVTWSKFHPECHTLICHQTFDGSTYENGFFAGDGVKPEDIVQERVISGHIHTPQAFGKVWYPGAPRWRTLSDANVERAIWLLEFDKTGAMTKTPFDTGTVCRKIYALDDVEGQLLPKHLPRKAGDVYRVEVRGSQAFLDERRLFWEAWGAQVRGVRTDAKTGIKVRESDGVGVAFGKWIDVFEPRHGTPKPVLKQMIKERVNGLHSD